jgi:hypothetical protein
VFLQRGLPFTAGEDTANRLRDYLRLEGGGRAHDDAASSRQLIRATASSRLGHDGLRAHRSGRQPRGSRARYTPTGSALAMTARAGYVGCWTSPVQPLAYPVRARRRRQHPVRGRRCPPPTGLSETPYGNSCISGRRLPGVDGTGGSSSVRWRGRTASSRCSPGAGRRGRPRTSTRTAAERRCRRNGQDLGGGAARGGLLRLGRPRRGSAVGRLGRAHDEAFDGVFLFDGLELVDDAAGEVRTDRWW